MRAGNHDLAVQHFLISAKLGYQDSLDNVKIMFMPCVVHRATKDDYAEALRGHQKAVAEMTSPDRDEAKALGFEKILSVRRAKS
mmetsp:Transcript_38393/g.86443  ORF Transcript_38393/g.86443 Transcript_38393/m.86443 type:complete len:84 (-) Transcript_38393:172-423(-)